MFGDPRRFMSMAACIGCLVSGAAGGRASAPYAARSHVVRMIGDATNVRFEPATVEISAGDTVVFEVVSGQPHNVAFDTTAMAPAVARQLSARMHDQIAPFAGPLLVKPGERYAVAFDGAQPGRYPFFCLPHQALHMMGEVVVR